MHLHAPPLAGPTRKPAPVRMLQLPEQNANAIVGEIFSALVIQSTLSAELQELEAQLANDARSDESVLLAAEEAIAMATQERGLRQAAQSKLRFLQSQRNSEAGVQEQLEEQRKQLSAREREVKETNTKAQRAVERHAAATHGLKAERLQQLRSQRRGFGVQRIVQLGFELKFLRAARRCFLMWRCKVVDACIFDIGHAHALAPSMRDGPSSDGTQRDDELAHAHHAAKLEARDAECLALRHRVAELEGRLALDDARAEALKRATERAAHATAGLLDARRQGCELAAALATANAALERQAALSRSPESVHESVHVD